NPDESADVEVVSGSEPDDDGRRTPAPASRTGFARERGRRSEPERVDTAQSLSDDLAALSRAFASASEQLLQEAARMQGSGIPPDVGALSSALSCQRSFVALPGKALKLAEALRVRSHTPERVVSLNDLAALIDAIAHAEAAAAKHEETRRQALGVLEQALALSSSDAVYQSHLDEYQTQARVLASAISNCPAFELPQDAERLSRGQHPIVGLLGRVQDEEGVGGELWPDGHGERAGALAPPLAVAAAGGGLAAMKPSAPHAADSPAEVTAETAVEAHAV